MDLPAARKVLGAAIGMCPKEALFKGYIQLEFDVRIEFIFFVATVLNMVCSSENSTESESCMKST